VSVVDAEVFRQTLQSPEMKIFEFAPAYRIQSMIQQHNFDAVNIGFMNEHVARMRIAMDIAISEDHFTVGDANFIANL
jgi:hypothetical protein